MVGPRWRVRSQCRHSFANAAAEYKRTRCARPIRQPAPRASAPLCRWKKMQLKIFQVIWVTQTGRARPSAFFFSPSVFAHFDPSIPTRRKGSSVRPLWRPRVAHRLQSASLCLFVYAYSYSSGDATTGCGGESDDSNVRRIIRPLTGATFRRLRPEISPPD